MKKYGVNELRRMYLTFFEGKEHLAMKSFSLVPHNDNGVGMGIPNRGAGDPRRIALCLCV